MTKMTGLNSNAAEPKHAAHNLTATRVRGQRCSIEASSTLVALLERLENKEKSANMNALRKLSQEMSINFRN